MLLILQNKIPKESISLISQWINELNIKLKFVNKRATKLGDFRYDTKKILFRSKVKTCILFDFV